MDVPERGKPDTMVMVHHAGRTHYKASPELPLPPIRELISLYEHVAAPLHPARVVALALNTVNLDEASARQESRRLEGELGIPVADPVRDGCGRLLDAVAAACRI